MRLGGQRRLVLPSKGTVTLSELSGGVDRDVILHTWYRSQERVVQTDLGKPTRGNAGGGGGPLSWCEGVASLGVLSRG
jgi:hypothetical protein